MSGAGFDRKASSAVRARLAFLLHTFCNSSIDGNIHVAVDVIVASVKQHSMSGNDFSITALNVRQRHSIA